MKYVWKKQEKEIYAPGEEPSLVKLGPTKYVCIKGVGNPNSENFTSRIGALYAVSYGIKMLPRKGIDVPGYFDYSVYPLEGLWDLTEDGRSSKKLIKDELVYSIMIKQPSFVTKEIFDIAHDLVKKKKKDVLLNEVFFEEMCDGLSVQIMHHGSYDDEPASFDKMKEYINNNNLKITTLVHREIYISDARKVEKDKLKTILRYRLIEKNK